MVTGQRKEEEEEEEKDETRENKKKKTKEEKKEFKTTHITNWASHVYQKNNLQMSFVRNQVLLQHLNQMLN